MHQRAAELRERVEVLRIVQTDHVWSWEVQRTTSAGVELGERTNLFSQVGIGARDASLVLRRQPITLQCPAVAGAAPVPDQSDRRKTGLDEREGCVGRTG